MRQALDSCSSKLSRIMNLCEGCHLRYALGKGLLASMLVLPLNVIYGSAHTNRHRNGFVWLGAI